MPLGGIYRTRTMSRKMYSTLGGGGGWSAQIVPSHNLNDESIAIELKRPGLIFPYVRSVVKVIGSESSGLRLQCNPSFQCENLGHYVMAGQRVSGATSLRCLRTTRSPLQVKPSRDLCRSV
jgi:hypothetical protein